MTYFPFAEYWWFYLAFSAFVLILLALDLGVFHREERATSFREATIWSVVWISIALAFNFAFYKYAAWALAHNPRLLHLAGFDSETAAREIGLQFLSGYLVEKALSLDNIFARFHLLKYGLAVVLVFVGLKMVWLNDAFGGEFPITWSLGIICGVIGLSILGSALSSNSSKSYPTTGA